MFGSCAIAGHARRPGPVNKRYSSARRGEQVRRTRTFIEIVLPMDSQVQRTGMVRKVPVLRTWGLFLQSVSITITVLTDLLVFAAGQDYTPGFAA